MARRVYTEDEKAEAVSLYESEGTSAASKKTGIPKNTIQGWARKAGVRTVRNENVRARVDAAQLDNAERRANLVKRLYGLAEQSVELVEKPAEYQTIMKGDMGVERSAMPGFIPAQDKQREMTAIGIMLDKAAVLEKFDNDNGAAEAKGLLVSLAEQIGVGSE
ncbi:MerR family transcriptional regulator [Brevibacterium oceani]|uniref:MerR family transcriptional regulator n=1 Tax=Brevibacterium oceani TaxID=358099 RepID=UPI0015E7D417|nr:MerR family transcriptional regulator [Brevibacterium oceani]